MSKNVISWDEADLLINKLINESIPVVAFFVAADGAHTTLRGFVDSATAEAGLVVCSTQGNPSAGSRLRVPITEGGEFAFGDKREMPKASREELAAQYGEAMLVLYLPSGSVFSLIFNP